jgi:hypothetical protein
MTDREKLNEKLKTEYDRFVSGLMLKTPGEIIESSYEKVFKEDIVMCYENDDYDDNVVTALLSCQYPLEELYRAWLGTPETYMDMLNDCILKKAKELEANIANGIEPVPEKRAPETAQAVNAVLSAGDLVLSTGSTDYPFLVGYVTDIVSLGLPEHDTGNPTADVYVDFTVNEYSDRRIAEIEQHFSQLYGERKEFNELPIDEVIMPPESLIRITGIESGILEELLNTAEEAGEYSYRILNPRFNELYTELIARVEKNYVDYNNSLKKSDPRELIDMAGKISAMSDAHSYLTVWHRFSEPELENLLQYQNPLGVVGDAWRNARVDLDDMSYTMEYVFDERAILAIQYPLISEPVENEKQQANPTVKRKQTLEERYRAANEKVRSYVPKKADGRDKGGR